MTRVVGEVFPAELGAETDVVCLFKNALFEFDIAESAPCLVARGGQVIVIVRRGELHGEQVLLGRSSTDDERDMIRRTSGRAERLHLLDHKGNECVRVEQGFCLLVEVGFVGRATTLRDAEETVLHTFGSLDVDLGGQVALRVHLVVHRERSVLRVAQIFFGVGFIDTFRESLFVAEASPDLLSFFAMNDGRSRVLAEGKLAFGRDFGVAQEGERDILVVGRGFRVGKNLGHLLVVRAAQEERNVAEGCVSHCGEAFGCYFQDGLTLELADRDVVFGQQVILSLVFAQLEHGRILKFRCLCHNNGIFSKLFCPLRDRTVAHPGCGMQAGISSCLCKVTTFLSAGNSPPREKFGSGSRQPRRMSATSSGVSVSRP